MKNTVITGIALICLLTLANLHTGTIHTEIDITGSNKAIWQTIEELETYGQWNPFIRSIEGELKPGHQLTVTIDNGGSGKMTFKPYIKRIDAAAELRWVGHLIIPGIFDGEHYFQLKTLENGQVRLIHGETFSGILTPLLFPLIETDTTNGFEKMNAALKTIVENSEKEKEATRKEVADKDPTGNVILAKVITK